MQPSAQDLYSNRASAYHRFVSVVRYPQALRAALRDLEFLRSGMKILDAGCGGGLVTLALREALASRGFDSGLVHGFDLTPAMLDRFRAVLREHRLSGIELREANVLHLDRLPESWRDYDLIVSSGMLEYLRRDQLSAALHGLQLRLRPGGSLVFFISRRNFMNRYVIQLWWKAQLYTREELAESLEKAGFSQVRFRRFPAGHQHMGLWGHFVEASR